jgi:hypothetical protein
MMPQFVHTMRGPNVGTGTLRCELYLSRLGSSSFFDAARSPSR